MYLVCGKRIVVFALGVVGLLAAGCGDGGGRKDGAADRAEASADGALGSGGATSIDGASGSGGAGGIDGALVPDGAAEAGGTADADGINGAGGAGGGSGGTEEIDGAPSTGGASGGGGAAGAGGTAGADGAVATPDSPSDILEQDALLGSDAISTGGQDSGADAADLVDVPGTGCGAGYHDGGDGTCVPIGVCATGYHNNGIGICVQAGCATGYHNGGDGTCVVAGTCVAGYHNEGDGVCVLDMPGGMGTGTGTFTSPDAAVVDAPAPADGSGGTPGSGGAVGPQFVPGTTSAVVVEDIGPAGGTVVGPTGTPIEGISVVFPEGALAAVSTVTLGTNSGMIVGLPSGEWSGTVLSLDVAGVSTFDQPIQVTFPVARDDEIPIPFYIDEGNQLRLMTLLSIDRTTHSATFLSTHASLYTWWLRSTGSASDTFTTSYRPENDGFEIPNSGSVFFRGECRGMTTFSLWYFQHHKSTDGNLYGRFYGNDHLVRMDPTGPVYVEDIVATLAYATVSQQFNAVVPLLEREINLTDEQSYYVITGRLRYTVSPVLLYLKKRSDHDHPTHSVLAYGYDDQGLLIYDPNHPGEATRIQFDHSSHEFLPHDGYDWILYEGEGDILWDEPFEQILNDARGGFQSNADAIVTVDTPQAGQSVSSTDVELVGKVVGAQTLVTLDVVGNLDAPFRMNLELDGSFRGALKLQVGENHLQFVTRGLDGDGKPVTLGSNLDTADFTIHVVLPAGPEPGTDAGTGTDAPEAGVVWVAAPVVSSPGACGVLTTTDSATLQFTVTSLANIDQFTFDVKEVSGCNAEPTGVSLNGYPSTGIAATPKTYTLQLLSPGKWYKYSVESTTTAAGYHSNNTVGWFMTAAAVPDAGAEPGAEPGPEPGPEAPDAGVDAPADSGTPPSCAGLAATCGPSGNESCCTSLAVPGGTFYRSYDGVDYTNMGYPATVSDFYLDKYEITVGRFRQFVNAGKGTQASPPAAGDGVHPLIAGSGWDTAWNTNLPTTTTTLKAALKCHLSDQTWTDDPGSNENRPINCITWYEAMAFCAWDGGRVPTEAEWNYAAAGGSEQRYYPWSSPENSTSIGYTNASYNCMGDGVSGCSLADILVVGSKPAGNGKWGQADMGGNVIEWTLDLWNDSRAYPIPCNNCADLATASYRVCRGGYFGNTYTDELQADLRNSANPSDRGNGLGSRCARTSL